MLRSALTKTFINLDATVTCPLLPAYLSLASSGPTPIFTYHDRRKSAKHLLGALEQERVYWTVVFTTFGGIGPFPTRHFLDSLFTATHAAEIAEGGTGAHTARQRSSFYSGLVHSLTVSTAEMLAYAFISPTANPRSQHGGGTPLPPSIT